MTSTHQPSVVTRVLDAVFGERPRDAELERFLTTRPPRWVRGAILLAYGLAMGLIVFWGAGALGWLPMPRQGFTLSSLWWINGFGLGVRLASDGIDRYYRRRAERGAR